MPTKLTLKIIALIFLFLAGCKPETTHSKESATLIQDTGIVRYSKRFSVQKVGNYYHVNVLGNRHNYDTTSRFILSEDTNGLSQQFKNTQIVKIPCKKVAALSSIYTSIIVELGSINNLIAIDNIDYIVNPLIIQKHKQGLLTELAKAPTPDIEKALNLQPDILFTFGMGEGESDKDSRMQKAGIPVAVSIDHLEETPLARAEWIKFFAVFLNKLPQADSVFNQVTINYNALKNIAASVKTKPSVFSEIKYSEFWYMPGGASCMANMMKDAGADYLWKDNTDFGSIPLSFEQVYAKAANADYWLNLSTLKTKQELLASESRYAGFKAYKTGNLFNNIKTVNSLGYSSYWETGMYHPERILNDFIQIFHPELKAQIKNDLYYYVQLK